MKIKLHIEPSFPEQTEVKLVLAQDHQANEWTLSGKHGSLYGEKESFEKNIPTKDAEKLIAKLSKGKIPAIPEEIIGLDGTTYTIDIEAGSNVVRYRFWGDLPKPLQNLTTTLLSWAEIKIEE